MSKLFIGIDPGSKGYLTAYDGETGELTHLAICDSTPYQIAQFLADKKAQYGNSISVCMELVHSIYGSSAKATFAFGEIFGMLQGIVIANGMKLNLVPPKTWQGEIWISSDKVKSNDKVDTKKTSINAGIRLFPTVDFRRTPSCKNLDDNKVDSTLIAEYARRKNL